MSTALCDLLVSDAHMQQCLSNERCDAVRVLVGCNTLHKHLIPLSVRNVHVLSGVDQGFQHTQYCIAIPHEGANQQRSAVEHNPVELLL